MPTRLVIQFFFFFFWFIRDFKTKSQIDQVISTLLPIGVKSWTSFCQLFYKYKVAKIFGYLTRVQQFTSVQKKADAAKLHVLASCQTPYGQRFEVQNMSTFPSNTNIQWDKSNTIFPYQVWWLYGFTCDGSLHLSKLEFELNYLSSCLKLLSSLLSLLSQVLTNI